jgi:hypothetical protein
MHRSSTAFWLRKRSAVAPFRQHREILTASRGFPTSQRAPSNRLRHLVLERTHWRVLLSELITTAWGLLMEDKRKQQQKHQANTLSHTQVK